MEDHSTERGKVEAKTCPRVYLDDYSLVPGLDVFAVRVELSSSSIAE